MPPKASVLSALAACRASAILKEAESLTTEVEVLRKEVLSLQEELPLVQEETARLTNAVKATETELAIVSKDIEQLMQTRTERRLAPPDPQVYAAVAQATEENNAIRLSLDSERLALEQLLMGFREASEVLRREEARLHEISLGVEGGGEPQQSMSLGDDDEAHWSDADLQELRYLRSLEERTRLQAVDLQRAQDAASSKERSEEEIRANELLLTKLRSELEACGVDVPVAPTTLRLQRATRQRERLAGVNLLPQTRHQDPIVLGSLDAGNVSLIRMPYSSSDPRAMVSSSATVTTNSGSTGTVEERRYVVPSGHLGALVNVLGPLRTIAATYSLESCTAAVGQDVNGSDTYIRLGRQPMVSSGSGGGAAVKHTVLVCRGLALYLHRFESVLATALTEASQLVSRVDGTLTYQSLYGGASQQQREIAEKLAAATGAVPTRSASAAQPAILGRGNNNSSGTALLTAPPRSRANSKQQQPGGGPDETSDEVNPNSKSNRATRFATAPSSAADASDSLMNDSSPTPRFATGSGAGVGGGASLFLGEEPMSILKADHAGSSAVGSRPRSLSWNTA